MSPVDQGVGRRDDRNRSIAMLAGVITITAAVYSRCLSNDFVSDDGPLVVNNPYIGDWSYLWKSMTRNLFWVAPVHDVSYYRPLQNVWLAINFHLFGLHPSGYHIAKILLHLIAVSLCFKLARLLTKDDKVAALAALLFGLIPAATEAVVFTSAIGEALAAVFEMASMILVLAAYDNWRGFAGSLALFGAAMLSFEGAVGFPLIVAVYFFLFELPSTENPTSRSLGRRLTTSALRSAPFFAVLVGYLALRVACVGAGGLHDTVRMPLHPPSEVLTAVPGVLVTCLKTLLVPWSAGALLPIGWPDGVRSAGFWLPAAILILLGLALFRRGPHRKLYLFFAAWLLIGLAPVMRVLSYDDSAGAEIMHDRYLYVPLFGWCAMAAQAVMSLARARILAIARVASLAAVSAYAILCIVFVWCEQPLWKDTLTLIQASTPVIAPNVAFQKYTNLARELESRGDRKGAEQALRELIRREPNNGLAHFYLGLLEQKMGNYAEAAHELSQSSAMIGDPKALSADDAEQKRDGSP